jgi:hypothetical protein
MGGEMARGHWGSRSGGGSRRARSRSIRFLIWVLALLVIVLLMSLLFGGFQKGTKVGSGPGRTTESSLMQVVRVWQ